MKIPSAKTMLQKPLFCLFACPRFAVVLLASLLPGLVQAANKDIITLAPSTVTFSTQTAGSTSAVQIAIVSNDGPGALNAIEVSITGDFSQTNDCPGKLSKGASCAISLLFTPTSSGTRAGSLTIRSTGQKSASLP